MTTPPSLTGSNEESPAVRGQLKWLAIAYYVWGGLGVLGTGVLLIFVLVFGVASLVPASEWSSMSASASTEATVTASTESGVTTETETETTSTEAVPATGTENHLSEDDAKAMATVFRAMTGVFVVALLFCWVICALIIYAGRCIQKRKRRVFVIVMGCLNLLSIPFGTALGIFTLITLTSAPAKREFENS